MDSKADQAKTESLEGLIAVEDDDDGPLPPPYYDDETMTEAAAAPYDLAAGSRGIRNHAL